MDSLEKYIQEQLAAVNISKDYSAEIQGLIERGIISEGMTPSAAYTTFLANQVDTHPVFNTILKRQYLFDISFILERDELADGLVSYTMPSGESGGRKQGTKGEPDICEKVECALRSSLLGRCEYIFTEERGAEMFVGIKLSGSAYQPLATKERRAASSDRMEPVPAYLIPYALIVRCFKDPASARFNEHIFEYSNSVSRADIDKVFAELIEHLKNIPLPLSIASYDLFHGRTTTLPVYQGYLYMGANKNWPNDPEARNCVRTAMYCQYYTKCTYSTVIDRDYVVFRYKNTYFRVQILTEEANSPRHTVALALQEHLAEQSGDFIRKARMARHLLGSLGFYPLIVDDFLVDCVTLAIGRDIVGDARFIESLLDFNWDLAGKHLSLTSLRLQPDHGSTLSTLRISKGEATFHCPLPRPEAIAELGNRMSGYKSSRHIVFSLEKTSESTGRLVAPKLAALDFDVFDFVLSRMPRDGFKEIVGAFISDFVLGTPDPHDFIGKRMRREATFYYDSYNDLLCVNVNHGYDPELMAKLVIAETSFGYIRMNR